MTATSEWLQPLLLSFEVAIVATLIALVLGGTAGWLLSRARRSALRELVDSVLMLPLVLPPTVLGYYLLVVFGREGWIGRWLDRWFDVQLVFTWQGAALAASVVCLPLILKAARTAFEAVDRDLEWAARTLGYGELQVFARITLPLAWRGILSGVLLAFARAMGEFGATLMIAGSIPGETQTVSIAIYEAVQAGRDPLAVQLVLVVSVLCIALMVGASLLLSREPRARRA